MGVTYEVGPSDSIVINSLKQGTSGSFKFTYNTDGVADPNWVPPVSDGDRSFFQEIFVDHENSKLFIFIAVLLLILLIVVCVAVIAVICRKNKKNKVKGDHDDVGAV